MDEPARTGIMQLVGEAFTFGTMTKRCLQELEEQRAGVAWMPKRLHQWQERLNGTGQVQVGIGGY